MYPEKIFYLNRLKSGLAFLICAVFFIVGIYVVRDHDPSGWALLVIFGFGLAVTGIQLSPKSNYFKMNQTGFERKVFFRLISRKWSEIENFEVVKLGFFKKRVLYNLASHAKSDTNYRWAIILENYGLPADPFAKLLNEYREHFNRLI